MLKVVKEKQDLNQVKYIKEEEGKILIAKKISNKDEGNVLICWCFHLSNLLMVKLINETGQHKYPCYSTRLL